MEMPHQPIHNSRFVQLDVWLGEPNAEGAVLDLWPVPFVGEPRIVQERPESQTTQCHLLELAFLAGQRIAVTVTWFAGSVRLPMLFRVL